MRHAETIARIVAAYDRRDRVLFVPGSTGTDRGARSGNSWAACFWAGFDGHTRGVRVPPRSLPVYGWYAAGRRVARRR